MTRAVIALIESCMSVSREDPMAFAINASKDGDSVLTVRISPIAAVDKARLLERLGWQVHITDSAGHQFDSTDFDRLLITERLPA